MGIKAWILWPERPSEFNFEAWDRTLRKDDASRADREALAVVVSDVVAIRRSAQSTDEVACVYVSEAVLKEHYDTRPSNHRAAVRRAFHTLSHTTSAVGGTFLWGAATALVCSLAAPAILSVAWSGPAFGLPGSLSPLEVFMSIGWLFQYLLLAGTVLLVVMPVVLLVDVTRSSTRQVVRANGIALLLEDREAQLLKGNFS